MPSIATYYEALKKNKRSRRGGKAANPEPPPTEGRETVWPYVLEDIKARVEMGKAKYGGPLKTGNGRDALEDAYQEAIDLILYLRQELLERDGQ